MKKFVSIVMFVVVGCLMTASAGNDNENNLSVNEAKVKSTIMKEMTYPNFASEQKIEGVVYVSFEFNKDGKMTIIKTNSASPALENYVVEKLKSINFITEDIEIGHEYNMKFTFKLY